MMRNVGGEDDIGEDPLDEGHLVVITRTSGLIRFPARMCHVGLFMVISGRML